MKRFADFATEEHALEGKKARIDDVLNQEIVMLACRVGSSKYQENGVRQYAMLQFTREGNGSELEVLFTGSRVLINQMDKYKDEMPFLTVIKKINRYYTLT